MTSPTNDESLTIDIDDGGAIIVHGDIDMAGGPILEAAILEREGLEREGLEREGLEHASTPDPASGPPTHGEHADRHQQPEEPADRHRALVIDLEDVSFIDSSGLRSLLGASRRARGRGSDVVLRSVGPEVARLLDITGTTSQFVIASHRD